MSIGLLPQYHSGENASAAAIPENEFLTQGFTGTIYSGVKFAADGNVYERQASGGYSNVGAWRIGSAAASTFYLRRTIDLGTLTTDDGGIVGGLRQMNADSEYDVQKSNNGEKMANVTFTIVNSGDSVEYASRTYIFTAIRGAV